MRKPVVAIDRRNPGPDVVSDEDLEYIAGMQAAAWQAHSAASNAARDLETRLLRGAVIVAQRYTWDPKLKMVRTRRKK